MDMFLYLWVKLKQSINMEDTNKEFDLEIDAYNLSKPSESKEPKYTVGDIVYIIVNNVVVSTEIISCTVESKKFSFISEKTGLLEQKIFYLIRYKVKYQKTKEFQEIEIFSSLEECNAILESQRVRERDYWLGQLNKKHRELISDLKIVEHYIKNIDTISEKELNNIVMPLDALGENLTSDDLLKDKRFVPVI